MKKISTLVLLVVFCVVTAWSLRGVEFSIREIVGGFRSAVERAGDLFPPAWHLLRDPDFRKDLRITIQIAIVATELAAMFAFPVSFLAARTTALSLPLASGIKFLLNLFRGVPTILYALLIVNIVGLGTLPGTLALAFGSFCIMTKMFAEVLETLDPGPIEAVRAVGARPTQVFVWGMLPQALPNFLSLALYVFELNIGASFILGFVGSGGLGFQLQTAMRLNQWNEACLIMLVIMLMVVVVDSVSFRVRSALA